MVNGEKQLLRAPELTKVLQAHFRQFVTGVRFVVQSDGEVALEVHFAQQGLRLVAGNSRHAQH